MTGRVLRVLAHIEVPCSRCNQPWFAMGLAEVDRLTGKIGDGETVSEERVIVCDKCNAESHKHVNKQNRDNRIRRKFAATK